MKLLRELTWDTSDPRGGVPGRGAVRGALWCVYQPKLVGNVIQPKLVFSDGRVVQTPEEVDNVVLSPNGKFAWIGQKSGMIYDNSLISTGVKGNGQHSFVYIDDLLPLKKMSTDAAGRALYEQTAGGWRYVNDAGTPISIKDTTGAAPDVRNFTAWSDVKIGMGQNGGIVAHLANETFRRVLVPGNWFDVVVSRVLGTFYILGVDYPGHRTCVWSTTFAEIAAAPKEAQPVPEFDFNHQVIVAPFKDPQRLSGAKYCIDDNSLGSGTEDADPRAAIEANATKRLFVVHDGPDLWTPPSTMRPWHVPVLELYLVNSDVLANVKRWQTNVLHVLDVWKYDVGVVPMCYTQAKPDAGDPRGWSDLYSIDQVYTALSYTSYIVNLSPRIKIVAPFEVVRENGATGHPELMLAVQAMVRAGTTSTSILQPVNPPKPSPKPDPEPQPQPQPEEDDMALMTNEQYEKAIQIAGDVACKYLSGVPGATQDACRQKAREATDRYKNAADADKRNPTIQELADNAVLQFAKDVPDFAVLDAYTAECLTLDREFKTREGLRR